jgi:thymidylate kinase
MMCACQIKRVRSVSFSGIDGAGKTTQIQALCAYLRREGLRVRLITFWDDVARMTKIRENTAHSVFKGDKGVGTRSAPINRRDKNVQSWFMTCVRLCLYFIDAISMRLVVMKTIHSDADFVIFDRYTYDELANLNLSNSMIRAYVRIIVKLVPKPDVSFLLDADPLKARARKPEYPLEFLGINRLSYLRLGEMIGGMTIIRPLPIHEVERQIQEQALADLSFGSTPIENGVSLALVGEPGESAKLDKSQARPIAY